MPARWKRVKRRSTRILRGGGEAMSNAPKMAFSVSVELGIYVGSLPILLRSDAYLLCTF